jgi:hypothetical protein
MIESLLGGLFGGVFRIVPEFLKIWDAKDTRKHELAMLDKEMEFAKLRAEREMHTVDAEVDKAHLDALGLALQGQAEMAKAGGKIAAALSALVRPLVTYWFVTLYSAVKIAMMLVAYEQGADWKSVLIESWNPEDMGIFTGIIAFWFVGRTFERQNTR